MKNEFNGIVVLTIAVILLFVCLSWGCGVGGFGPCITQTVTITSKHIDAGKEESHYMVSTDKGSFEVDNGLLLGLWNADEVYGALKEGKTYNITTKGKKWVNPFMQTYPYIVSFSEVQNVEKSN